MIVNILIMYLVTAAIAFFVAFIIKMIFYSIYILKNFKSKLHSSDATFISTQDILQVQKDAGPLSSEGEIHAAIAMALFLFTEEKKEFEKLDLTIKKTMKPYSPWNSKIYGLRQHPR